MRRLATLLALCTATLISRPDRVRPCTPAQPSVWARHVLPADGTSDVPINARISIVYDSYRIPIHHFVVPIVRIEGAEPIAGSTSTIVTEISVTQVFVPDAPLAPNTTYEVLDELCVGCGSQTDASGALTVVARFTTGSTRDDTPPPPPSGVIADVRLDVCSESSCCGPYQARRIDIRWDEIPAESLGEIDLDGTVTAYVTRPSALGWLRCFGGYSPGAQIEATGTVSLRHTDLAGNLSEAVVVPVDLPACQTGQGDDEQAVEVVEPGPEMAEVVEPTPTESDGCRTGGLDFTGLLLLFGANATLTAPRPRPSRPARHA